MSWDFTSFNAPTLDSVCTLVPMILGGFLSVFLNVNLSLTSEQEVLECYLFCIVWGQLDPKQRRCPQYSGDEGSVAPTIGHSLMVGHEINLESHGQHLKKMK